MQLFINNFKIIRHIRRQTDRFQAIIQTIKRDFLPLRVVDVPFQRSILQNMAGDVNLKRKIVSHREAFPIDTFLPVIYRQSY